jgi:hypothetical protein
LGGQQLLPAALEASLHLWPFLVDLSPFRGGEAENQVTDRRGEMPEISVDVIMIVSGCCFFCWNNSGCILAPHPPLGCVDAFVINGTLVTRTSSFHLALVTPEDDPHGFGCVQLSRLFTCHFTQRAHSKVRDRENSGRFQFRRSPTVAPEDINLKVFF